jgi:uncharacterized phiE125 gp8 family phage protein
MEGIDGMMVPYGSLNLTATSPIQSFTEPISRAEAKAYLNLPERSPTDAEEDALIDSFISAAREIAETLQGRDLVRKQWDLSLDYFHCYEIECRAPLASVDLVKYRDSDGNYTTLTEGTDYIVDTAKQPGWVLPAYGEQWPSFTAWPSSAVLVRYTSGYASTDAFWSGPGDRIKTGMKMLISMWYNGRIPFVQSLDVKEYPFAVTTLMSYGARPNVR